MKKILVIGQVPPPIGGQAVMIEKLVSAEYSKIEIIHVPMQFSRSMADMSQVQLRKIACLVGIIVKVFWTRLRHRIDAVYYPPSGPTNAVYRDIAVLLPVRFLFRKTVFHFHASGLSQNYGRFDGFRKLLFRMAFFKPDLCIHLSSGCPQEGEFLSSRRNVIIPYGLPDNALGFKRATDDSQELRSLFVGLLDSSKGELELMRACHLLKQMGIKCSVRIAGEFKSAKHKESFNKLRDDLSLNSEVEHVGIIQGKKKQDAFEWANVFCFPSFFHSESFPLVLIEAMQYQLPIVASRWRGIPDMVEDGQNGFLVDVKNAHQLADRLKDLSMDSELRKRMGECGRAMFESRFSLEVHIRKIEEALESV